MSALPSRHQQRRCHVPTSEITYSRLFACDQRGFTLWTMATPKISILSCRDKPDARDFSERGGQGTGCDPASRRRDLEKAETEVAYRRRLLEELDEAA
jgi:hypothetical protein